MQKQTNFFEQHVQWFALGLGGLFLAWMLYSYVLSQPVKVDVAGQALGPGQVDPTTLNGPVAQLRRDIEKPDIPTIRVKDYVESFVAAIKGGNTQVANLAGTGINYVPAERATGVPGVDGSDTVLVKGETPIKELPKLPAARFVTSVSGRSSVTFPEPGWEPDPRRPQVQQPMLEADKDWVTLSFTVNGEVLAKAFKTAFDEKKLNEYGVPDPLVFLQTALLDVELVRQQILPGGKVGKEEVVNRLQNSLLPPFPAKNAPEIEVFNYLTIIAQNPNEVMFPPFYEVLAGDEWTMPTEDNERDVAMDRAARLAQRKLQAEQRRQQNLQRRQMAQQQRFRGRPGMAPPGMEEGMFEGDMEMEAPFMPPPGGRFIPPRPGVPGARQPAPGAGQMQGGKFDVETYGDVTFIVHDDSLEAGKTYRYKVRYRLLNPAYKTGRLAPEAVTKEVAIESPYTGWTDKITARPKVEFFLARLGAGNEPKGEFHVFEWKNGQMTRQTVSAAPGDAIGSTGWSMVDVRAGRPAYGLLVDETGLMHRREPEDPNNPSDRYLFLLDEWELANPQVGLNR